MRLYSLQFLQDELSLSLYEIDREIRHQHIVPVAKGGRILYRLDRDYGQDRTQKKKYSDMHKACVRTALYATRKH